MGEPTAVEETIRLSICIPTFNFGTFIGETLSSIVHQSTPQVEIVIVDGGSTDDTVSVVESFRRRFANFNYVRLPKKGGIDWDIATAVEHARGMYCWLFGADDIMMEGAIQRVLDEIQSGHDLYLCETTLCTIDLKPIRSYRNLKLASEASFDLSDSVERGHYFALACNTQPFFSFCGALIFNRARWNASTCEEAFLGSCWAHAARIFNMMATRLLIKHLPLSLSMKRGDNDSFLDKGLTNRIKIGIEGYQRLGEHFFGRTSLELLHIRRCLRAEYTLPYMLVAKWKCAQRGSKADLRQLDQLFDNLYWGATPWARIPWVIFHLTPPETIQALIWFKRRIKRFLEQCSPRAERRT